jgi:hypothetical protein
MPLDISQQMSRFKTIYGDGTVELLNGRIFSVPNWLGAMMIHLSGVRSKKKRIQKKVVKREFQNLLREYIKQE